MGNSLACRMFSYSCTVWVSLPHVLPGPYSFQNAIFLLSLSPSNTLPILVIPIIRSHPFPLLVRHTISPSGILLHTFELLPPFPRTSSRLVDRPSFHNRSAQQLSIFLAILFLQFYCTTVLFTPHFVVCTSLPQPKLSLSLSLSLALTVLVLPVTSSSCCLSGILECAKCLCCNRIRWYSPGGPILRPWST